MAEKDINEKTLEAHNDVFADIVNGLLFKGEKVLQEQNLITLIRASKNDRTCV